LLAIIGTYVIYSSWSDYSECALAPSAVCQVTTQAYIQFLGRQIYGNLTASYGLISMIVGAILYTSAQVRKVGVVAREVSSNSPKNEKP